MLSSPAGTSKHSDGGGGAALATGPSLLASLAAVKMGRPRLPVLYLSRRSQLSMKLMRSPVFASMIGSLKDCSHGSTIGSFVGTSEVKLKLPLSYLNPTVKLVAGMRGVQLDLKHRPLSQILMVRNGLLQ